MSFGKYWQTLVCALPLCSVVQTRICEGASGAPRSIDYPKLGAVLPSEFISDAGATSIRETASVLEPKIVWEIPIGPHAQEPKVGSINASLAAEELARWNIGGNGSATYVSNRIGYHPGTRVVVDVEASETSRTQASKTRLIRHYLAEFRNLGYWPYRLCFESAAREIHSKGGDTWMQVRINSQGRVMVAKLRRMNVDPPQIATCILNATRSIKLIRTASIAVAIMMRVRVFPGDAPLSITGKSQAGKATVERNHIRSALESVKDTIEQCIRDGIAQDPRLWGRLAMLLQFNELGQMVRSDEYDSHFPDSSVVKCANLALSEMHLARAPEPTAIIVALRVGTLPTSIGEPNAEQRPPKEATSNSSGH